MLIGVWPNRVKQASQNEQAEEPEEEARVEPGANRFNGKNRGRKLAGLSRTHTYYRRAKVRVKQKKFV